MQYLKRIITDIRVITVISVLLFAICMPAAVFAVTPEEETEVYEAISELEHISSDDAGDPEALFSGYVDQAFYGSPQPSSNKLKARRVTQGSRLTDWNRYIYDLLVEKVSAVAAGGLDSTEFTFELEGFTPLNQFFTAEDLGVDQLFNSENKPATGVLSKLIAANGVEISFEKVLNALLSDFPYEAYWYDKVKGGIGTFQATYSRMLDNSSIRLVSVTYVVRMSVSQNYAIPIQNDNGAYYTADTAITSKASVSAENARNIVSENASLSDYDKLIAYKDAICSLTSYNRDAADKSSSTPYGDPWQMVYVFDNDPETNVVCEGYSKAFQYLCDQSTFTGEVTCNTMTGTMSGGTGAGGHMWNVISICCGNYIADITNSDTGTVGYAAAPADCTLFLKGSATNADASGYTLPTRTKNIVYQYDDDAIKTFTDPERTLSETAYDPDAPVEHDWIIEKTDPDCENAGEMFYVCSRNSDHTKREVIAPLGHSLKENKKTDPSCETEGNIAYWTCETCGKLFSDSAGEHEITAEDIIIPAFGHNLTYEAGTEVTCTMDGILPHWHCERCGKDYADEQAAQLLTGEELVIHAEGHQYDDPVWSWTYADDGKSITAVRASFPCRDCSEIAEPEVTLTDELTAPTAFEDGEIVYTASVTWNGRTWTDTRNILLEATDHHHVMIHHPEEGSSCTEDGISEYWVCDICGRLYLDQNGRQETTEEAVIQKASGHKLNHKEEIPATCTEDGQIEHWVCGVCGKLFGDADAELDLSRESVIETATGHEYTFLDNWDIDGGKYRVEFHFECKYCHDSYTASQEEVTYSEGVEPGDERRHYYEASMIFHDQQCISRIVKRTDEIDADRVAELVRDLPEIPDPESVTLEDEGKVAAVKQAYAAYMELTEEQQALAAESTEVWQQGEGETAIAALKQAYDRICALEEEARQEADRLELERLELERQEQERQEQERLEQERLEQERQEKARQEEELPPAKGADGTALGTGASAAAAAKAITSSSSEEGPAGSAYGILQARVKSAKKNAITIRWTKVPGATQYIVYGNKCGKKLVELSRTKKLTLTQKKLKKGTYYKYLVVAVKGTGKQQTVVASSKVIHITTLGGKNSNYKSVKVNKSKVKLKAKKTFKIKAKLVIKGKKAKNHRKLAYESSNPKVATVNKKGKIKAIKKGTCKIYVYAQDGTFKAIKVTVK